MSCNSENEYTIKYPERSVVYAVWKAKKGQLEKIVIKKYDLKVEEQTGGAAVILYTDTLNATWFEGELCSHAEAIELATAYWTAVLAIAEDA